MNGEWGAKGMTIEELKAEWEEKKQRPGSMMAFSYDHASKLLLVADLAIKQFDADLLGRGGDPEMAAAIDDLLGEK